VYSSLCSAIARVLNSECQPTTNDITHRRRNHRDGGILAIVRLAVGMKMLKTIAPSRNDRREYAWLLDHGNSTARLVRETTVIAARAFNRSINFPLNLPHPIDSAQGQH
jgi:hypothetical protein